MACRFLGNLVPPLMCPPTSMPMSMPTPLPAPLGSLPFLLAENIKYTGYISACYRYKCLTYGIMLNTTHLLISMGFWDLQSKKQNIYHASVHPPRTRITPLVQLKNEHNTTLIIGQHDSCSRLPLSPYNASALTFQSPTQTTQKKTVEQLTGEPPPSSSPCLSSSSFCHLLQEKREQDLLPLCNICYY